MSFLKKYACLYGGAELSPEDQAEVGAFAAEVMKCASAGDDNGLVELFRKEFGDIDEETFDRIDRYMDYLYVVEKEAAVDLSSAGTASTLKALANILAPLSLALAATPLIGQAAKAVGRSIGLRSSLKEAIRMNPELKNDPNVPMYFRAISDFAPDVAKNALVAGNVLTQMHRIGPSLLTPQLIGQLISMQGQIKAPASEAAAGMSKPSLDLAKYWAKITEKDDR